MKSLTMDTCLHAVRVLGYAAVGISVHCICEWYPSWLEKAPAAPWLVLGAVVLATAVDAAAYLSFRSEMFGRLTDLALKEPWRVKEVENAKTELAGLVQEVGELKLNAISEHLVKVSAACDQALQAIQGLAEIPEAETALTSITELRDLLADAKDLKQIASGKA